MKIKNILISQPAPAPTDRSPFQDMAVKHGVEITFYPFISVERVSVREFRQQRVEVLQHSAVIFTNRSSVDHFFQLCEQMRITVPETMKYFCVTEAIALYLQKYIVYRKRKIFFGKVTFTDLMEQVLKHKEERFLLPLPDSHKPEIPKTLDKLKIKYNKVILSHTVNADLEKTDINNYDILVFYSPSEISNLVGKYPKVGDRPLIATFGNGTAVSAVEAGLRVSVIAPTVEYPSMVNALDAFITRYNAGEAIADVVVEKKKTDISHLKVDSKGSRRSSKPKNAKGAVSAKKAETAGVKKKVVAPKTITTLKTSPAKVSLASAKSVVSKVK